MKSLYCYSLISVLFLSPGGGLALGRAHDVHAGSPAAGPPNPSSASSPALAGSAATKPSADAALGDLGRTTRQPPADADVWVRLGNTIMQRSRETMDSQLYEKAEAAYHRALTLDANHEQALVGLAWVHNSEHEFEEGRRWAEKALAVNPEQQHAHALLGDGAVELGDYEAAFGHYQKALDIRPDLSSYSRAAHLLWLTGNDRRARWLMQKAIDAGGPKAENTAWCRAELARMLWHNGSLLAAEQEAARAFQEAPTNPHVLVMMGLTKTAKKEYEAAIAFYERALAVVTSHETLVALAELYAITGRQEDAQKANQQLVALHTKGGHSHEGRTHTHAGEGNAQLALFYANHDRDLDEAVRAAEMAARTYKNVFVLDTLAWCYYKKGRYEDARNTILKALRWKTPDASIFFHAGMICARMGDSGSAKNYLYRALSLNPYFHPRDSRTAAEMLNTLSEAGRGLTARGVPDAG